jgi:LacI family transcriptional regulator
MKRAGIHKIAELAKVSIGTVDRALHGRDGISESTRKKILRIAKQLDYSPHPAARALSIGRAHIRIGVCIPEEIHFFYDQMRSGIFDEAARVSGLGLDLVYRPAPRLGEREKQHVTDLLQSGVSAMIITPGDPKVVGPLISKAEKSGIRVVCITTDAPRSHRSSLVSVDPALSGTLAAELIAKFLPPSSQVAVVTGMLSTEEHRAKAEGFRSAFEADCPGGKVVAVLEAHESEEESYRKTNALLDQQPKLSGIYVSTVNCLPVCRAVQERKLSGKVRLITTDLFREMIPYLQRGTIAASIYQDPYLQGQTAIRILVDHLANGAAIPQTCYLNPGIVLRSNLGLFREAARK